MIDKWLNKVDQLDSKLFYWCIIAASILLAAWMQKIQHGWINPDSVLYLEQARLFALKDWQGILAVYEWPLYGVCIGIVHQWTTLPIHTSAQLLNMVFFGIATASFLQLIKLAGGNNRTWLMASLLLFGSQYIVGDILEMLMRDEGFWAFYLTALVFFVRYIQQQKISDALLWQLSIIIATLFRIEAILYQLLLPIIYLLKQGNISIKQLFQQLLKTYSISLLLGIIITIVILTQPQLNISSFGRLDEVFTSSLYEQFTQKLFTQADIMSTEVLGTYLEEFAIPGLLITFVYVIGSKTLTSTGLVGVGLAFLGFKNNDKEMSLPVKSILFIVGCIALFSAGLIIIKVFVLSSRYVIALAWILLIFASFYLASLSKSLSKVKRITVMTLILILSLSVIKNILPKREGYNYAQNAVKWAKFHNIERSPIFYDDVRMVYYAGAPFKKKWDDNWDATLSAISDGEIQKHALLLITHSKKNSHRLEVMKAKLPNYVEIKRFSNAKSKKFIVVYARK